MRQTAMWRTTDAASVQLRTAVTRHDLVMVTMAVAQTGVVGYVVLFCAVAASWVGLPIIGAGVLAAAAVLASQDEMSIWLVIVVATLGAWIGGFGGYELGRHAGIAIAEKPGPLHSHRRTVMLSGEVLYRRWGRLAVFVTPTFVSGALKMPVRTFLRWNAAAALLSTAITALGTYGVGTAILGRLASRQGALALAVAGVALLVAVWLVRRRPRRIRRPDDLSVPDPDDHEEPARSGASMSGRGESPAPPT
jgi:membrane-associated protein